MSDRPRFEHFLDSLTTSLDINTKLRVYHVSTEPVPTTSIFSAAPGQPDERTSCESHFLTISQSHVISSASIRSDYPPTNHEEPSTRSSHVLILGIEVLIFSTESSTTIFVSKADSTGFLSRPASAQHIKQGSPSVIKTVISAFLKWLVAWQLSLPTSGSADSHGVGPVVDHANEDAPTGRTLGQIGCRRRPRRLTLSLFARSQNQYLFPGSIENATKHVLDDRQLIKWWCRLLDELVQEKNRQEVATDLAKPLQDDDQQLPRSLSADGSKSPSKTHAYVVVPGCDRTDTIRSFFPASARHPQPGSIPTWHNSYPVDSIVPQEHSSTEPPAKSLPVRCLIPRLPDDPKARYCDDLDNAGIDGNGQWRDIRSLQQFWETMEYRQECGAGRLVGFVWVVFDTGRGSADAPDAVPPPLMANTNAIVQTTDESVTVDETGGSRHADELLESSPMTQTGSILLSKEQYITLSDLLIDDTDFAGPDLAVKSTQEWTDKVKELTGLQTFGVDVEGKNVRQPMDTSGPTAAKADNGMQMVTGLKHPRDEGVATVNVLTGIRKKKQKVVQELTSANDQTRQQEHPLRESNSEHRNGFIATEQSTKAQDQAQVRAANDVPNGVKTLSAGLVRKKQKPRPQGETTS